MDFGVISEQEMFRQMFTNFAGKEVAKLADQIDRNEAMPCKLLAKAAAQGFWGAITPNSAAEQGSIRSAIRSCWRRLRRSA